jgi:hypothetical protein
MTIRVATFAALALLVFDFPADVVGPLGYPVSYEIKPVDNAMSLLLPEDFLPAWTTANRPIENTDIVVWYTLGLHHVVRAEDWPVLPTGRMTVELRPFDFFARNPALDLPGAP